MERTPINQPIAKLGKIAAGSAPGGQLLLAPPPRTWSSRAASVFSDRWNALRNDTRLRVEAHMIAAPVIALTAGFLTGRLLYFVLSRPRQNKQNW